jgi:hypothetical protein
MSPCTQRRYVVGVQRGHCRRAIVIDVQVVLNTGRNRGIFLERPPSIGRSLSQGICPCTTL